MKRTVCLLLVMLMLSGCVPKGEEIQESVTFYYLRAEVSYGTADGVITGQTVEASGHAGDLHYLLALYLTGPADTHLRSPFPRDVSLTRAVSREDGLTIELEGSFSAMTDLEITKACACLATTCFGLTEAETISIRLSGRGGSEPQTIEITRDSLILQDLIPETT